MSAEPWDGCAYVVPIVFCFLVRDDKILLIRRANEPYKGEVTIPGGRKKRGESLREAVAREMAEETGYLLEDFSFAGILHAVKDSDGMEAVSHYFVCRGFGGSLRESDEGTLLWADVAESLSLPGIHPFYSYLLPRALSGPPFEAFVRIGAGGDCTYSPLR